MSINTVTGAISSKELGKTLMHEHLIFGYPGCMADKTMHISKDIVMKKSIDHARKLVANGFQSFLDVTPNDYCRDVEFLRKVSEETGLQILCATGLYTAASGSSGYWNIRSLVSPSIVDEIAELMIQEITEGVEDTGIKAAVIKVGTGGDVMQPYEEQVFLAAAKAQKATGAPIYTHSEHGALAYEQAKLLIDNGATAEKIIIGHMGDCLDADYHDKILSLGVNIGFDRMGQAYLGIPDDDEKLKMLRHDTDAGMLDRIVMSHDVLGTNLGRKFEFETPELKKMFCNFNYEYIPETLIPRLLEQEGYTKEQLDAIFVQNPARILDI